MGGRARAASHISKIPKGVMLSTCCGTSGEDANWKVVLRLHVQLCGPGRIHGPVEFVVWLVIVVPAVTPKVVLFGIDDIIASWRLHMAVSKQKIRAIIMAIRRPLCVTRR